MSVKKRSAALPQTHPKQPRETPPDRQKPDTPCKIEDIQAVITKLEKEVAERKNLGETLKLSRERMKGLSRRTLDLLEADRRSISKELHDSIGASLAAIKFSLEDKELTRKQNQGHLSESLDQEIGYLMQTIKETKRISANLRPTTLDDLGLMATIKWYLRQFNTLYGDIAVYYSATVQEEDIPEDMQIIIYRIIQEGLSNAEKHSEARSVRMSLEFAEDRRAVVLKIEDDGTGFDVDEILSNKDPLSGYGLTAMVERCEIYGGSLQIESRRSRGTRIVALLPL